MEKASVTKNFDNVIIILFVVYSISFNYFSTFFGTKKTPPPANYLGRRKRGAFITYMQFNELIDIIYKDITRPEDSNPRHMVPETIALSPELRAHEKIRQD